MKPTIRRAIAFSLALCSITLGLTAAFADGWPQWMQNPQHTGFLNVVGQNLNQNLANIVYDPLVETEMQAVIPIQGEEALLVHHQTPLVDGSDVFMESKAGTYSTKTFSTPTGDHEPVT